MQSTKSYVKDTSVFLSKLKELGKVLDGAVLVTAGVVGIYPNIPHEEGLNALSEKLETFQDKKIVKEDLLKMAKFVMKNNIFEFNSKPNSKYQEQK